MDDGLYDGWYSFRTDIYILNIKVLEIENNR